MSKNILNGFGILNPEILNPDLRKGFGIYKSRGTEIGIGIPMGTILDMLKTNDHAYR
jgi:hypothetical protein